MALKIEIEKADVLKVIYEFKKTYGMDFGNYAEMSFKRRIEHIIGSHNLSGIDELISRVKQSKEYFQVVVNDITVNTTDLFRDVPVWLNLRRNVLNIFRNKAHVNIWHAGCSSGEEVYSMLILLNELNLLDKAKVFATDINTDILDRARKGVFNSRLHHSYFDNFDKVIKVNPLNFEETIDIPYDKYFELEPLHKTFRIKKFLRDKVTFKYHNLVEGTVFYKFDLIFCRNVIIYFNTDLQSKVISLFHESLFSDGMLLIGAHENITYLPVGSKFETKIMKGLYFKK